MTNRQGKNRAFKDGLIWCHSLTASSAKTTVPINNFKAKGEK